MQPAERVASPKLEHYQSSFATEVPWSFLCFYNHTYTKCSRMFQVTIASMIYLKGRGSIK